MDLTANFGLGKPLVGENYDVEVFNNNADITDFQLDAHRDRLDAMDAAEDAHFSTSPQRCRVNVTAAQSVANNAPEQLDFNGATITYDATPAMADLANDCIKIKQAGWYIITLRVCWINNSNGDRFTLIRKGSTVLAEDYRKAATTNTIITLSSGPVLLAVDDQINGYISQSSGGNLTLENVAGASAWLSVVWLPQ